MSVNKVILIGNVGQDPEIRYLDNQSRVASINLATTEKWKDRQGETHSANEWHKITGWRHLADLAEQYIKKGSQIYVEGKLTTRQWEDKDGNKRYTTEIVASNIQPLYRKRDGSATENNQPGPQGSQAEADLLKTKSSTPME